jgi:hypothetical protein
MQQHQHVEQQMQKAAMQEGIGDEHRDRLAGQTGCQPSVSDRRPEGEVDQRRAAQLGQTEERRFQKREQDLGHRADRHDPEHDRGVAVGRGTEAPVHGAAMTGGRARRKASPRRGIAAVHAEM